MKSIKNFSLLLLIVINSFHLFEDFIQKPAFDFVCFQKFQIEKNIPKKIEDAMVFNDWFRYIATRL